MVRVSSPPQSQSKAVVCVSTPRMYPRCGYFLVNSYSLALFCILDKDKREEELEEGQEGLEVWGEFDVTLRALDKVTL